MFFHRSRPRARFGLVAAGVFVTVVAATAGTAVACPSASLASSPPAAPVSLSPAGLSPATAYAVAVAIRDSPLTSEVPDAEYLVEGIRLAASDPTWALAEIRPVMDTIGPAVAVVRQTVIGWELAQLGSYEVGCGVAPAAVLADFELSCPSAEGLLPA